MIFPTEIWNFIFKLGFTELDYSIKEYHSLRLTSRDFSDIIYDLRKYIQISAKINSRVIQRFYFNFIKPKKHIFNIGDHDTNLLYIPTMVKKGNESKLDKLGLDLKKLKWYSSNNPIIPFCRENKYVNLIGQLLGQKGLSYTITGIENWWMYYPKSVVSDIVKLDISIILCTDRILCYIFTTFFDIIEMIVIECLVDIHALEIGFHVDERIYSRDNIPKGTIITTSLFKGGIPSLHIRNLLWIRFYTKDSHPKNTIVANIKYRGCLLDTKTRSKVIGKCLVLTSATKYSEAPYYITSNGCINKLINNIEVNGDPDLYPDLFFNSSKK